MEGGATLGSDTKALQSMSGQKNVSYAYSNPVTVAVGSNNYVADRSDSKDGDLFFVNDRGYNAYNAYKNWSYSTNKFDVPENTRAYLQALGVKYNVQFHMTSSEVEAPGYAPHWVGNARAQQRGPHHALRRQL